MNPRIRFQQRAPLARKTGSVAAWIAAENAKGHICACGRGKPIRILTLAPLAVHPQLPARTPPHGDGHGDPPVQGGWALTSTAVARMLGIGKTTLRRIEGRLFEPAPRQGSRKMRVFT